MLDHGLSRWKIRKAREAAGAASAPRGRPRGTTVTVTSVKPLPKSHRNAAQRILGRMIREARPGGAPPSYDLLLARFVAVDRARKEGDRLAELDALEGLAAAAGLVLDHLQRLQAA